MNQSRKGKEEKLFLEEYKHVHQITSVTTSVYVAPRNMFVIFFLP